MKLLAIHSFAIRSSAGTSVTFNTRLQQNLSEVRLSNHLLLCPFLHCRPSRINLPSVPSADLPSIISLRQPYPTLPYPIPWLLIRYLVPARCQQQSTTPSVCAFSPTNVDITLDLTLHSSSLSVHSIQVITLHFSILRLSSHRIFPPYCSEKCETDRIHHRSLSPFHSICPPTFPPFSNQFLPFHPSVQTLFACLAPSTSLSFYLHPSDNTNHTLPYPTLP